MPKLACVAGEPSGDLLAAPVLSALNQIPDMADLEVYGIGGPLMQAQGFRSDWPMETLSVRGYVEAIQQLPAILRLRKELIHTLLTENRPDVYLGIDAPDFNLGVEMQLRKAGIPILHFVSPSIWAWRAGRIKKIAQAVDRMLCIFPFETAIYERAGIAATYVGHPLASDIPLQPDTSGARQKLSQLLHLSSDKLDGTVVAVLPGSRGSEIELIAPIFFDTMAVLANKLKGQKLYFLIPVATARLRAPLEALKSQLQNQYPEIQIHLIDGHADLVLEAADVVLIASGTATLQAALWKKPMVISYKVPWLTGQIMKRQGYLPYVGLPNILCGEFVVPELLQNEATPEALANALMTWLENPNKVTQLKSRFTEMHETLRRPTGLLVAQAVNHEIQSKHAQSKSK
ncbi:lipid-A-disaccharide synthase [Polynucleobacter paneuropaeus]|uniref:Lipid-A-disaccharide synthase n=1 Tax=Polynucleobacter paneuropaeus TaxID=2527775 RepID=A0AAE3CH49_9BURK|nr:lipid-A-disaccharide synthase [Polynucleobacter paneuropaeus]MBT8589837.1 lipid-A-disaccharide synthase [Polynucleobacter paneuropaeus]MBT8590791.1 lipid-A-disaccharide synthase [Polynucleobacter paneuropaeus]MBT8596182.1 lipid-A-disaccharide synthase [Polynucleobacter paneuropaeus]MBT8597995.1 lipid-A-disaccharide synthase [Polynucleobacter paneuropaeus]